VIRAGDLAITKQVVVGEADTRLAPVVYRKGDWRMLGYPAEPPIAAEAGVLAVELPYTRGRGEFAGLSSASWLLVVATLVLGFALRGLPAFQQPARGYLVGGFAKGSRRAEPAMAVRPTRHGFASDTKHCR
jgi:hypothetical protein